MFNRYRHRPGLDLLVASAILTLSGALSVAAENDSGRHDSDHASARDVRDHDSNPLLRGLKSWGPVGTPLPAGAELVTQARFLELLSTGGAVSFAPPDHEDGDHEYSDHDLDDHQKRSQADTLHRRSVMQFLRQHPDLTDLARLVANQPVAGQGATPNADGTWTILPDGVGHPVETMGRSTLFSWIYDSVLFAGDRAGHLALYNQLYDGLVHSSDAANGGALAQIINELPTPGSLSDASLDTINGALQIIGRNSQAIVSVIPTHLGPRFLGCNGEIGASTYNPVYGDRSGNNPVCGPIVGGLYEKINFLNKGFPTCVKDQGSRGTCHTFAVASATEERYSLDQGIKVNLSEQDEMEHYRLNWQRALYVESGDAWEEINDIIGLNYVYPLEHQWDYNPSYGRDTSTTPFKHSCDNVAGEPCSDTAPQSALACGNFGAFMVCILYDPGIHGTKYRATAANYFWDSTNPELSAEYMLLQLAFNNTVAMGFTVSPAFSSPSGGFVKYSAQDLAAKPLGGHVVHVVSFVTNADLAIALPNAPPAAGLGYFVVKNSWNTCYGDGGYVYLPWEYVKAQTTQAFAVSQVN